ncbi:MAG: hypothetical protein LIO75_09360 [Lachnospiraceae bacterium]|nr:hypothetical protein [Lachnospiraceae bacterium]
MKKIAAIILAGVLALGCSMTAFASSSTGTASDASITVDNDYTVDSTGSHFSVVISQDYASDEDEAAANALAADPEGTLSDLVSSGVLTSEEASDVVFKAVMNVSVDGDADAVTWPMTVRFNIAGVTSSSKVVALLYYNGAWQSVEVTSLGDGYADLLLYYTGPVAIYVDEDTVESANAAASGSSDSSSTTSPETGAFPLARTLGVVAAAAVAGMLITVRRRYAEA